MDGEPPDAAELDEEALLEGLRRGDDGAFEQLVRSLGGRMLAVARRLLRSDADAEDAVQDGFLQAFRKIDTFEGGSKVSTWLHRIVVNAALMKLRKQKRTHEVSMEDLLPRFMEDGHRIDATGPWEVTPEDVVHRQELQQLVHEKIDQLPDSYRTVLVLRDIEQRDTAESAELLGLSVNATKTRLHRARQALRALLDPHLRGAAT